MPPLTEYSDRRGVLQGRLAIFLLAILLGFATIIGSYGVAGAYTLSIAAVVVLQLGGIVLLVWQQRAFRRRAVQPPASG